MWKKIAIVVGVFIGAVLAIAALQPGSFRVERAATIGAPPEKVFAVLSDFHRWDAWSPWEKLDPGMKRIHSGSQSGRGAVYAWEGNSKVGRGRMEIIESVPPSKVTIKLDFLDPFEAHNITEFTLVPTGETTEVRWVMHGPSPYLTKLMGMFVSMDDMVGGDFETGLANLKAVAERG